MSNKRIIRIAAIALTVVVLAVVIWLVWPRPQRYYTMTIEEIDTDIRRVSRETPHVQDRMEYYSERFLGAPYELVVEGDGPYARYDQMPLLNLEQINCMTYCEIVMALSLSDYYMDFFNILQRIRYRDGIIGMASRNHYTMADWLPANSWCLEDVSRSIAGDQTASVSRVISHKAFFADKGIDTIPVMMLDREISVDYIPFSVLAEIPDRLQSGDVVALIQDRPGIFSAHMLLFIRTEEGPVFRHASMSADKTVDSPFKEYIRSLDENPRYIGMSFMRIKDDIQWYERDDHYGKFIPPLPLVEREEWNAVPPTGDGQSQNPAQITLHHSGVVYTGDPNSLVYVKNIQSFHQNENGWIDIAYHYLIDRQGRIYKGRDEETVGDTSTEYDPSNQILVCLLGNFEEQTPTDPQLEALSRLGAELCQRYSIDPDSITSHRDLSEQTVCPGEHFYELVKEGVIVKTIKERLRYRS